VGSDLPLRTGNRFHPSRIAEDLYGIIVTMRSRPDRPETRKSSKEGGNQPGDRYCGKGSQSPDIDCIDPGERPDSLVTGGVSEQRSPRGILHEISRNPPRE
jgi:hypothetical protein